ncbi:MAG: hypothetical protein ACD_20C00425G0004 [uncultured bacterium]|nr:MAG: hypothetical protein ACD_20C00425G0004 [uncultured bacterium]HBH18525.1 hypothetical protein [Cyanobacteria bacterium UBA9579]
MNKEFYCICWKDADNIKKSNTPRSKEEAEDMIAHLSNIFPMVETWVELYDLTNQTDVKFLERCLQNS